MDKKISELNVATTLTDADVLPIVNQNETKKVSIATIKDQVTVNADWNATIGKAQILNKPTIPTSVTQTSQLTNNGEDGLNPFITALDIPIGSQASTLVREVKNMTGATLVKGTVVYISGANGNKALVSKALATTDALSSRTFGLLQSDILNNGLGNCVIIGDLTGVNTSMFVEGAQLYLSGVIAGTYTSTKILAPTHLVYVGKVTRAHPTQGQIEVGIQNGYELEEIHDVSITSETNEDFLQYESATQLWKNKQLSATLIKSKLGVTTLNRRLYQSTTVVPLLGTTTLTVMASMLIPANSLETNDVLKLNVFYSNLNTAVSTFPFIYTNTTNSLTGATLLGKASPSISNNFIPFERTFNVKDTTISGLNSLFVTYSDVLPMSVGTPPFTSATFNKAVDNYLLFAVQLGTTLGSMELHSISLIAQ
jgi:ribosomal protein L35AE/L33A